MKKQLADRQGDVTLVHSDLSPEQMLKKYEKHQVKPDRRNRIVLAEGEVTGHAHVLENKGVSFFKPPHLPEGHALLVVTETTVERGSLIEGKVLSTMPGGTIRFQQTDGTIIRFAPDDVQIKEGVGVCVNRAHSLLRHDEHDAIPVSKGVFTVIQHQTADMQARRRVIGD